jgi:hypothetical protein
VPKGEFGVVYVATGDRSRLEALRSLRSLRRFSPGVPAAVFTDADGVDSALWREADEASLVEHPHFGFRDKILPLLDRPFSRSLFLDADTWVRCPLQPLFELLDAVDVAATPDSWRVGVPVPVPDAFVEPNTGVLLLGPGAAVDDVIRQWDTHFVGMLDERERVLAEAAKQPLYGQSGIPSPALHDQPAFRWAVWGAMVAGNIRYASLPDEANVRSWLPGALSAGATPWIVHSHSDEGEAIAAALESSPYARVWLPNLSGGMSGQISNELVLGGRRAGSARAALRGLDRVRRLATRLSRRDR